MIGMSRAHTKQFSHSHSWGESSSPEEGDDVLAAGGEDRGR